MAVMQGLALLAVWRQQLAYAMSCAERCPITAAFLESDCNKYSGQQAKLMYGQHGFFQGLFTERSRQFQNCTGLSIGLTPIPFADLVAEMSTDLDPTQGIQSFDAYMVKLVSFQNYAHQLEDLSSYLDQPRPDYIQWYDILNTVRAKLATYQSTIKTLPIDADFVQAMVREDILFAKSLEVPETWEEWAELSEALDGQDLNGDGTPDYGTCVPMRNWARDYPLFNIVAAKVQRNGEGIFFDSKTFAPLVNTTAYRLALRLLRRIVLTSPFKDHNDCCDWFQTRTLFMQGRCALYMDLPGLLKGVDTSIVQRTNASNGDVLWQPQRSDGSYWAPVRIFSPGSEEVLDIPSNSMRPCTTQLCPIASTSPRSDKLINRAPFWATGGWGVALAAHSKQKEGMWHFLAWMNRPEQSTIDAARPGYCDSWRKTHLSTSATEIFKSKGWNTAQLSSFRGIVLEATKQGSNAAMDLRLPGGSEYTKAFSTNMQLRFLGKKLCNESCTSGLDFVAAPRAEWLSEDDVVSALYDDWEEITKSNGGRYKQLMRYRSSLSLGPLPKNILCKHFSVEANEEDSYTCMECNSGSFYDRNSDSCKPCQAGFFTPSSGYDHCLNCADGFASSTEGSTACAPCSMGTYSFPAGNASSCQPCPLGHIAPGRSWGSSCQACTVGFFQNQNGTTACEACPQGTYQNIIGQSYCESCATLFPGMTTDLRGAATADQCGCAPGTYRVDLHSSECQSCPAAMICPGFSSLPRVRSGFWSSPSDPLSLYECSDPVCIGGDPGSCVAGGRFGFMCMDCPDDYNMHETGCSKCSTWNQTFMPLALVVICCGLIMVYYTSNTKLLANATVEVVLTSVVGMIVTMFQMLGMFSYLGVSWSKMETSEGITSSGKPFVGRVQHFGIGCIFGFDPVVNFSLMVMIPFGIAAYIAVCCVLSRVIARFSVNPSLIKRWEIHKALNALGTIYMAMFITLVTISVSPFQVYSHPNKKQSVTRFPQVLSGDAAYWAMVVMSVFAICFFIAPYTTWCIWGVWKSGSYVPSQIDETWAPSQTVIAAGLKLYESFRFVLYKFRPGCWWWGIALLSRQFLLAFAPVLPYSEPHIQAVYVCIVLLCYVVLSSFCYPWKSDTLNFLDITQCLGLVIFIIVSTSFMEASTNLNVYVILMIAVFFVLVASQFYVIGFAIIGRVRHGRWASMERCCSTQGPPTRLHEIWHELCETSAAIPLKDMKHLIARMSVHDWRTLALAAGAWHALAPDRFPARKSMMCRLIGLEHSLFYRRGDTTQELVRRCTSSLSSASSALQEFNGELYPSEGLEEPPNADQESSKEQPNQPYTKILGRSLECIEEASTHDSAEQSVCERETTGSTAPILRFGAHPMWCAVSRSNGKHSVEVKHVLVDL